MFFYTSKNRLTVTSNHFPLLEKLEGPGTILFHCIPTHGGICINAGTLVAWLMVIHAIVMRVAACSVNHGACGHQYHYKFFHSYHANTRNNNGASHRLTAHALPQRLFTR